MSYEEDEDETTFVPVKMTDVPRDTYYICVGDTDKKGWWRVYGCWVIQDFPGLLHLTPNIILQIKNLPKITLSLLDPMNRDSTHVCILMEYDAKNESNEEQDSMQLQLRLQNYLDQRFSQDTEFNVNFTNVATKTYLDFPARWSDVRDPQQLWYLPNEKALRIFFCFTHRTIPYTAPEEKLEQYANFIQPSDPPNFYQHDGKLKDRTSNIIGIECHQRFDVFSGAIISLLSVPSIASYLSYNFNTDFLTKLKSVYLMLTNSKINHAIPNTELLKIFNYSLPTEWKPTVITDPLDHIVPQFSNETRNPKSMRWKIRGTDGYMNYLTLKVVEGKEILRTLKEYHGPEIDHLNMPDLAWVYFDRTHTGKRNRVNFELPLQLNLGSAAHVPRFKKYYYAFAVIAMKGPETRGEYYTTIRNPGDNYWLQYTNGNVNTVDHFLGLESTNAVLTLYIAKDTAQYHMNKQSLPLGDVHIPQLSISFKEPDSNLPLEQQIPEYIKKYMTPKHKIPIRYRTIKPKEKYINSRTLNVITNEDLKKSNLALYPGLGVPYSSYTMHEDVSLEELYQTLSPWDKNCVRLWGCKQDSQGFYYIDKCMPFNTKIKTLCPKVEDRYTLYVETTSLPSEDNEHPPYPSDKDVLIFIKGFYMDKWVMPIQFIDSFLAKKNELLSNLVKCPRNESSGSEYTPRVRYREHLIFYYEDPETYQLIKLQKHDRTLLENIYAIGKELVHGTVIVIEDPMNSFSYKNLGEPAVDLNPLIKTANFPLHDNPDVDMSATEFLAGFKCTHAYQFYDCKSRRIGLNIFMDDKRIMTINAALSINCQQLAQIINEYKNLNVASITIGENTYASTSDTELTEHFQQAFGPDNFVSVIITT